MMKTVPPLNDLFNMAGLNLPSYLKGKDPVVDPNASSVDPSQAVDGIDDVTEIPPGK